MERRHISPDSSPLPGYDALRSEQYFVDRIASPDAYEFSPKRAYHLYHRIHKVYVGPSGAKFLGDIHDALHDEQLPEYLDVAAWAAAEAALVDTSASTEARVGLIESAESCWSRALAAQEMLNHSDAPEYFKEADTPYRIALNLAFAQLMKALVVGNVTPKIREQVFVDVMAIAGTATTQRVFAGQHMDRRTLSSLIGFEHECNALAGLLAMDDPRYIPLPSSARVGSGRDYPEQTHDMVVVNQHWGTILKTTPVEIKAHTSLHNLKRYDALIVRGKMHLATNGLHDPAHTREAFAAYYDGSDTRKQSAVVFQVVATMKDLLQGYARGNRKDTSSRVTRYYDTSGLVDEHPEFSLDRGK